MSVDESSASDQKEQTKLDPESAVIEPELPPQTGNTSDAPTNSNDLPQEVPPLFRREGYEGYTDAVWRPPYEYIPALKTKDELIEHLSEALEEMASEFAVPDTENLTSGAPPPKIPVFDPDIPEPQIRIVQSHRTVSPAQLPQHETSEAPKTEPTTGQHHVVTEDQNTQTGVSTAGVDAVVTARSRPDTTENSSGGLARNTSTQFQTGQFFMPEGIEPPPEAPSAPPPPNANQPGRQFESTTPMQGVSDGLEVRRMIATQQAGNKPAGTKPPDTPPLEMQPPEDSPKPSLSTVRLQDATDPKPAGKPLSLPPMFSRTGSFQAISVPEPVNEDQQKAHTGLQAIPAPPGRQRVPQPPDFSKLAPRPEPTGPQSVTGQHTPAIRRADELTGQHVQAIKRPNLTSPQTPATGRSEVTGPQSPAQAQPQPSAPQSASARPEAIAPHALAASRPEATGPQPPLIVEKSIDKSADQPGAAGVGLTPPVTPDRGLSNVVPSAAAPQTKNTATPNMPPDDAVISVPVAPQSAAPPNQPQSMPSGAPPTAPAQGASGVRTQPLPAATAWPAAPAASAWSTPDRKAGQWAPPPAAAATNQTIGSNSNNAAQKPASNGAQFGSESSSSPPTITAVTGAAAQVASPPPAAISTPQPNTVPVTAAINAGTAPGPRSTLSSLVPPTVGATNQQQPPPAPPTPGPRSTLSSLLPAPARPRSTAADPAVHAAQNLAPPDSAQRASSTSSPLVPPPPAAAASANISLSMPPLAVPANGQRAGLDLQEETGMVLPGSAPNPEPNQKISEEFGKSVPGLTPPSKPFETQPSAKRLAAEKRKAEALKEGLPQLPAKLAVQPPSEQPEPPKPKPKTTEPKKPKRDDDPHRADRFSKLLHDTPGGPKTLRASQSGGQGWHGFVELCRGKWLVLVMVLLAIPCLISVGVLLSYVTKSFIGTNISPAQRAGKDAFNEGNYDTAVNWFNEAIKADGQKPDIFQDRARAHLHLQQYPEAIADYTAALKLNPNYRSARLDRAAAFYWLGNYPKAIDDYDQLLKDDSHNSDAYFGRGLSYSKLRNYDQSLHDLEQVVSLNPKHPAAFEDIANAYLAKGELNKAIEAYSQSIKNNPRDGNAYYMRANTNKRLNKLPEALNDFATAIDIAPGRFEFYNDRGFTLFEQGKYAEAIADYATALELNPGYEMARHNRTIACEQLIKKSNKEGKNPAALTGLAYAQLNMEDYGAALAAANKALVIDPKFAPALLIRANIELKQKHYDFAVGDADAALRIKSNDKGALLIRARANLHLGHYDRAIKDYDACIAENDNSSLFALRERSLSHILSNEGALAASDAQQFLDLNGWNNALSAPAVLLSWLAKRQLQDTDGANAVLSQAETHLKPGLWPYPIIKYLKKHEITLSQLDSSAKNDREVTDVHVWTGFDYLLSGLTDKAATEFSWVKRKGYQDNDDYLLAVEQVNSLEKR